MGECDVLVLCGDQLRHKFFAASLLKRFPNSSVAFERFDSNACRQYKQENTALMENHFKDFKETEAGFFKEAVESDAGLLANRTLWSVEKGGIHGLYSKIIELNPKLIVVYSTSILKKELINAFPKRIINLHAGLSPYYRGSGTNFYPFYDKRLDCVGMTVHYIDAGIDSGEIVLQGRPELEAGDNTHSVGCKCVLVGVELMKKVVEHWLEFGECRSRKQAKVEGSLHLMKDFSEEKIKAVNRLLEEGLVEGFLASEKKGVGIVEAIE